jgi:CelD/BcsL family acetyltransferase involved in cellulose biosynthesis
MLHVERAAGDGAIEKLAAEWTELDASLHPRLPFTSPLWNQLWWQHFRTQSAWVRDELFVHAVRSDSGALLAVAPMTLTSRPAYGPLRVRALQMLGADENVTELRSVIARSADTIEVLTTLSKYFGNEAHRWDLLQWCGVPNNAAARTVLEQGGRIQWGREVPNYYLPLSGSWEDFKSGLSRNMKEALRKCYNSLKRGGHEFTFRVVSDPAEAPAALQTFFALHAERSQADHLPQHRDVFIRPMARNFLIDYAQQMAERDQLRIFQLLIGAQVVATRVGFVLGDQLFLYYSGYQVAWAPHSVMTTVVSETIQWAMQQGLSGVGLSTGRDLSKLRWKPQEFATCEGVQASSRPLRQLAAGAYLHVTERATRDTVLGRLLSSARRAKL